MKYVTIADLKKQAKKERKNNNSIKNHAESLNVVAKQNNYENWSVLLDNAVLIKAEKLTDCQKLSLLKEFINDTVSLINEFKLIFKTTNHEMLAIFINKNFLPENTGQEDNDFFWKERAKKWMECVCFIFLQSDLPRNINGFRNCWRFENMLEIIHTSNLYENENVKYLFNLLGYQPEKDKVIAPSYDVLQQNGYCSMQYTARMGFIADSISKVFGHEFSVTKNKIKETILNNHLWFTYHHSSLSDIPILDQKSLLTDYVNSFKDEVDFKKELKRHLDLI